MSGENPVDEESKKLLEDLEKQDKTSAPKKKAEPKKKAAPKNKAPESSKAGPGTALVSDAPVVEKAAVVEKPEPAPVVDAAVFPKGTANVVMNIGKNPRRIGGTVVAVGKSYTLTEQDLQNETLLLKIDHAISLGVLSHGAD